MVVTDRRELIAGLVDSGCPLPEIEREVIDRDRGLDDDERAALWLYAWAYESTRSRVAAGLTGPVSGATHS